MNIWDRTPSSCDGSSAEVEQPRKNNEDWQKQCADGTKIQGNTSALASQIVNVGLKQRTRNKSARLVHRFQISRLNYAKAGEVIERAILKRALDQKDFIRFSYRCHLTREGDSSEEENWEQPEGQRNTMLICSERKQEQQKTYSNRNRQPSDSAPLQ